MQVLGVLPDGVAYTHFDISSDPDSFAKEALCGLLGQAAEMQLRKNNGVCRGGDDIGWTKFPLQVAADFYGQAAEFAAEVAGSVCIITKS